MADKPGAGTTTATLEPDPKTPPNDKPAGGDAPAVPAGGPNGTEAAPDDKSDAAATKDTSKPGEVKTPDAKPLGAPETYADFTVPEGFTLPPEGMKTWKEKSKALNLSQEQSQELLNFQTELTRTEMEKQAASFKALQDQWKKDTQKILGPKPEETLALVARSRERFVDADLKKVFEESGLGDHPAVINHLIKLGKLISEDGVVTGKPAVNAGGDRTPGQVMYPSQPK